MIRVAAIVEGIIFDLDGTLVDSAPGIERCLRQALAEVAPGSQPRVLPGLVGPPVRDMVARLLPGADDALLDAGVAAFRRCYDGGGWRDTAPYEGAEQMLKTLGSAGRRLFIVTNKPRVPTDRILAHLGWRGLFDAVACRDDGASASADKATALAHLMESESLYTERIVFVGDTVDDAVAAQRRGLAFILAAYGYGGRDAAAAARAVATIESPGALLALIDVVSG